MELIGPQDRTWAVQALVRAFADDPVERWLYTDDDLYRSAVPELIDALGGHAFDTSTAWRSADRAAVALWLPPDVDPDGDAIGEVLARTVPAAKLDATVALGAKLGEVHPARPCWYLAWLAVEPDRQGQGAGGRLLAQCLERVDTDGMPAYLESSNVRKVPLYQRHGFEVIAVTDDSECPPVTCMLRPAVIEEAAAPLPTIPA